MSSCLTLAQTLSVPDRFDQSGEMSPDRATAGDPRRPAGLAGHHRHRPGGAAWPSPSAPRAATSSICAGSGTGSRASPGATAATRWPAAPSCRRCCWTPTRRPPSLSASPATSASSGLELAAGTALAKVTESAPARARGALTAVGTTAAGRPDRRHHGSSRVLLALAHACRQGTPVHLRRDARRRAPPARPAPPPGQGRGALVPGGLRAPAGGGACTRWPGSPGWIRRPPAGHSPAPRRRRSLRPGLLATGPRRYRVRVRLHLGRPGPRPGRPGHGTITDEGADLPAEPGYRRPGLGGALPGLPQRRLRRARARWN